MHRDPTKKITQNALYNLASLISLISFKSKCLGSPLTTTKFYASFSYSFLHSSGVLLKDAQMALMISFPSMYPLYVILLIDTYGFITTPKDFSLLLSSCSIWFMLFIFPLIAKESLKHLYTASLSIYISSINSSAHCKSYIVST